MAGNHHKICFFLIFPGFIQHLDPLRVVCWEPGNSFRLIVLKNEGDACAGWVGFVLKAVCTLSYRRLCCIKKITCSCSFDSGFFSGKKLVSSLVRNWLQLGFLFISSSSKQLYFPSQPIKVFSLIHSFLQKLCTRHVQNDERCKIIFSPPRVVWFFQLSSYENNTPTEICILGVLGKKAAEKRLSCPCEPSFVVSGSSGHKGKFVTEW